MQTTPGPNYKKEAGEMIAGVLVLSTIILIGVFVQKDNQPTKPEREKPATLVPHKKIETISTPAPQKDNVPIEETILAPSTPPTIILPPTPTNVSQYIEIIDSCDAHFTGDCLRVRSGPGTEYAVVSSLRNGVVLKVSDVVEQNGIMWYKIIFDEWLRYPNRVAGDWYVAGNYVRAFYDEGERTIADDKYASTSKSIVVDRSEQKLYAYDGDTLFTEQTISTGLELTPTPRGTFTIYKKMPSRYMQGPLPYLADKQYYDLPGVPWNLYFTEGGAVIHGAYWHTSFGKPYSHGCVNLPLAEAEKLYIWADLGTTVTVRD